MQLDEELWGPDAREFNPDRWFAEDIAMKEKYWLVVSVHSSKIEKSAPS